ncbi:unnamed protein product [Rotaria sp. Silwood1]|nr:unnamed protein product [Rotaria sp. Silwood1]CAF3786296.1 unnamed protein product [Rotaria sp. Silwood1]CAF4647886.1 unnamed protein product [Rotaria sp. Silwood1]CAF4763797.1 unnamed protein product [Rotaria sp. Silwood1]
MANNEIQDENFKELSLTELHNNESNTKIQHLQIIANNNFSNHNNEDDKKTINQSNNDQVITSQNTGSSELLAESVNISSKSTINHNNKSLTKTNRKSRKNIIQDHLSNENNKQRSLSSSSSSSSSSSTSSSTSNDNQISNIPYETLYNDEDDDNDNLFEHTNKTTN